MPRGDNLTNEDRARGGRNSHGKKTPSTDKSSSSKNTDNSDSEENNEETK